MNNTVPTDNTKLVQEIQHALETEEFASDAVSKVRQILAPVVPAEGLPPFDYESATEPERWAFDQGHEDGWRAAHDPSTMDLSDIREEILILVAALDRMIAAEKAKPNRGRIEFQGSVIPLPDQPEENQ